MRGRKQHPFCRKRIEWRLKHPSAAETLQGVLEMVCIEVGMATIKTWTPLQCAQAEEWACQVHLSASDNSHIRIPPKPEFLPEEKEFGEMFESKGRLA